MTPDQPVYICFTHAVVGWDTDLPAKQPHRWCPKSPRWAGGHVSNPHDRCGWYTLTPSNDE